MVILRTAILYSWASGVCIHSQNIWATNVCVTLNGLFLLLKQMKAEFIPYIIFFTSEPMGREGWNME